MEDNGKITVSQAVIVEGKYDKIKLEAVLDGLILPTNGFGIFKDAEMKRFIRSLAETRGLIVLTDSDGAGFRIRSYLSGMLPAEQITHVYIPDILGKEKRKQTPSAEGKLGVEGVEVSILRAALARAGVVASEPLPQRAEPITRLDLYEDGLMGGADSRTLRYALCDALALPRRLNITALLPLLNSLLSRAEYKALLAKHRSA